MLISVIIPTCNRNDLLAKCLDRLAPGNQTLSKGQYEVIVTDDGTNPGGRDFIAQNFPWCSWIEGPHRGPAANRNRGSQQASGKWLVFFDDDCIPNSDVLEHYKKAIKQYEEIRVFEGRIFVDRPKRRFDEESPVNETGGYLWSCNFCIDRALFHEIGGFDEDFPYAAMEDVDLHYRLKNMAISVKFIQQAGVFHPWRLKGGWKKMVKHHISTKYYLSKHPEEKQRLNSRYYLVSFKNSGLDILRNFVKYRGAGIMHSLLYSFRQFYLSIVFLIHVD